jgi:hypothetical protein
MHTLVETVFDSSFDHPIVVRSCRQIVNVEGINSSENQLMDCHKREVLMVKGMEID